MGAKEIFFLKQIPFAPFFYLYEQLKKEFLKEVYDLLG